MCFTNHYYMNMTTKEKLIDYIKYKKISKKRFYDITGFANGFLDSGKYIGTDKLKIVIEKFTDLNFEWLILDRGEMILNSSNIIPSIEKDKQLLIDGFEKHIKTLNELVEEKERLINDKERTIKILMKNILPVKKDVMVEY